MDLQVKICGVRDEAGALACRDALVDLVGFNFVPTSKRFVEPAAARCLVGIVGGARAVGVFRNQAERDVLDAVEHSGVRWIQLHGDESPALCSSLRERGYRVIKAIAIRGATTGAEIASFEAATDFRLFDAAVPGSGRVFDHARLAALRPVRPFLLAGGLHADNVGAAVAQTWPDGVDTASGVECGGRIERARVVAFCRAARSAARKR